VKNRLQPVVVPASDLDARWARRYLYPLAFVASLAVSHCAAQAQTMGLHLYSPHFAVDRDAPEHLQPRDVTPGLYWRGESGLTLGVVRNSHARWAGYAGYTWETEGRRWAALVGAISSYQYRKYTGPSACGKKQRANAEVDPESCWWVVGNTSAYLRPLVALSVAVPEAAPILGGATPRISWIGKALHLSVEARF